MADVTIIGAGPAGLYLAKQLAGLEVEILEEHSEIGKPVQCTGLISKNIDELLEVPEECMLNKVKGARLYSPSGKVVELKRKEDQAYVVDRAIFDKKLAEGLDITFSSRVSSLDFDSKIIVGADGPNSTVAKLAEFPRIEETLTGLQYIIKESYDPDFVELHFGTNIANGFFAWVVPAGEFLRVGLATKENPKQYLDNFLNKKFPSAEILETQAGVIPMKWRSQIVKENIALVGDAAGQVKPTTGGGVYMGLSSAKILADAIKEDELEKYEKEWNEKIKPELSTGNLIRNVLKKLSDEEMEEIWGVLQKPSIKELIEEHGDMDKPTALVKAVVKNPNIMKLLPYLRYLRG